MSMKHHWNIMTGQNWSTWRQTFQSLTKKRINSYNGITVCFETGNYEHTFQPSVPSRHPNISFITHNTLQPLYLKLLSLWCKINFCLALEELYEHFSIICNSGTRRIHIVKLKDTACSYTPANWGRRCLACWCREIFFHADISEWTGTFHACLNKITM